MKRKIFFGFFLSVVLLGMTPSSANAQFEKRPDCAVMPGNPAKEKFFVDYKGERIHFCCRSCMKRFKKHSEKYWARLHEENRSWSPRL